MMKNKSVVNYFFYSAKLFAFYFENPNVEKYFYNLCLAFFALMQF